MVFLEPLEVLILGDIVIGLGCQGAGPHLVIRGVLLPGSATGTEHGLPQRPRGLLPSMRGGEGRVREGREGE